MAEAKTITAAELIEKFQQALDDGWGYIWGTAGVMWTAARQKQLEKTTDDNRKMSRMYGSKWIGHMVADCSGLFVWAFKQYGMQMSHISSNIYKSYCTNVKGNLTPELKQSIRPGTAVFTGQTAGKHPHVGLYIGGGWVIEAAGTKAGVIRSKITDKKWTFYGELKGVDYEGGGVIPTPEPEPEPKKLPTIRKGNRGETVKKLQRMLDRLGYNLGICGVDGDYGVATEKAVKEFQQDHRLDADGVTGPKTWEALQKAVESLETKPADEKYTVTIKGLEKESAEELAKKYPGAEMRKE